MSEERTNAEMQLCEAFYRALPHHIRVETASEYRDADVDVITLCTLVKHLRARLAEAEARGVAKEKERCVQVIARYAATKSGDVQDALFCAVSFCHSEKTAELYFAAVDCEHETKGGE